MEEFQRRVLEPCRRFCIQGIELVVELESYDEQARARFETDEERQRNNEIFTTTISTLFKILSSWPHDAMIEVDIKAKSPSDYLALKTWRERKQRRQAASSRVNDLLEKRYEPSYLEFSRTTTDWECPHVPAITSFSIEGLADDRLIEPASSVFIALKLPRLDCVHLRIKDECNRDERLRQRLRTDFARNIHLFPASVRQVDLQFHYEPPRDQNYAPPDITEDGMDLLSSRLRCFSQRLERLSINESMVVSAEIFWPSNPQGDSFIELPYWPNLIDVSVECAPISPSGKWFLGRDSTETEDGTEHGYNSSWDDDEEDYPEWVRIPLEDRKDIIFRTKIIAGHLNRFYVSAGQAGLRMPKLRRLNLGTVGRPRYSIEYEVRAETAKLTWRNEVLCEPGTIDPLARLEIARSLYQPDEQVFEVWRKVALEHTVRRLEIEFEEWGG